MQLFKPLKYSKGTDSKFLFIRHGKSICNADPDGIGKLTNYKYVDTRLSDIGIQQCQELSSIINNIDIEKVYVSPLYRALQTGTFVLKNHPNLNNIIMEVHPEIAESPNCIDDMIFNIKQTKNDFNMNSIVKVDWSYYDDFIKNTKYDENYYYFNYFNALNDKERNDIYIKLKDLYNKEQYDLLAHEMCVLPKLRFERQIDNESPNIYVKDLINLNLIY